MVEEKVIDLIAKLLRLSTSSNEHEAALAASRAQELLIKHNLSMAEIEAHRDDKDKTPVNLLSETLDITVPKNYGDWKKFLIASVAKYNLCKAILSSDGSRVYIIGPQQNVEVVKLLYGWLVDQIMTLSSKACKEYTGYDRIPTFRRAFFIGAVDTVRNRLYQNWMEMESKNNKCTALMVNTTALIDSYIGEKFGQVHQGKGHRVADSSRDGIVAGQRAGHQVSLQAQHRIGGGN